jgi:pyruvate/2-oxoglutarate/acetoin dehydrogenase E1 component
VERVGAAATPIPFAPVAEARAVPQVSDIADAVRRVLEN